LIGKFLRRISGHHDVPVRPDPVRPLTPGDEDRLVPRCMRRRGEAEEIGFRTAARRITPANETDPHVARWWWNALTSPEYRHPSVAVQRCGCIEIPSPSHSATLPRKRSP